MFNYYLYFIVDITFFFFKYFLGMIIFLIFLKHFVFTKYFLFLFQGLCVATLFCFLNGEVCKFNNYIITHAKLKMVKKIFWVKKLLI